MVSGFVVGTGYAWYKQNILEALYGWLGGLILSIVVRLPVYILPRRCRLTKLASIALCPFLAMV